MQGGASHSHTTTKELSREQTTANRPDPQINHCQQTRTTDKPLQMGPDTNKPLQVDPDTSKPLQMEPPTTEMLRRRPARDSSQQVRPCWCHVECSSLSKAMISSQKTLLVSVLDDSWAFLVPADLEQVSQTALKVGHFKI